MKTLRFSLSIALLLLAAVPVAAQTELTVWHSYRGGERAAFEKVIGMFNEAMKADGISAKTLAVPHDAYPDKISAAVPRGKGPDVFIYAQDRLGGWIEAGGTIEPIGFYLDEEIEGRFIPSTLDAMRYQDEVYGLPLNFKVVTLIYNKKLVTNPPKTTGELVALAKKHTDQNAGRFGLAYWYSDFYYHSALMNGLGGGVFDGNSKPTLNSAANVQSMDLLLKWFDTEKILPAEPTTALITNLFNEGRAAMVFSGPWFLGEVSDDIDMGFATLPTLDEAGGKPMRPWVTVEGVYIAEPSEHKDEAFELLTFLTSAEAGVVMALEGRQTPANKGAYDDAKVGGDPVLKAFRNQVETGIPMPNIAEMTMMWSPATTAMNIIVKRAATPKAALDDAQEKLIERIKNLRQ